MSTVAVALAVAASTAYGVSDVLAGSVVRRHTASSVALWAQFIGLVVLSAAVLVARPEPAVPAVAWGTLGGVLAAAGILAFYTALQNGPTSIVAPVSGAGVLIPVVGGLVTGDDPDPVVLSGLLFLVVGILVIALRSGNAPHTTDGRPRRPPGTPGPSRPAAVHDDCRPFSYARPARAAVLLSVLAASCFGFFFVSVDLATSGAGSAEGDGALAMALLVALAIQAGAFVVTGIAAARHTLRCVRPSLRLLRPVAAIALLDVTADVALTHAIAEGPLAVVGPLGTLDPVIAVLLAAVFLGERLTRWQVVGVSLALTGIVLVSL